MLLILTWEHPMKKISMDFVIQQWSRAIYELKIIGIRIGGNSLCSKKTKKHLYAYINFILG